MAICKLCEKWFVEGLPQRHNVTTQLLPTLLLHALQTGDLVHRIYQVRTALTLLDLDDESAQVLNQLLQRCFLSACFLSKAEGRKFLALTMTCSNKLAQDIHQIVKSQLVHLSKSASKTSQDTIEAFADVYYEAWRLQPEGVESFVQDLMECSLFLANSPLAKVVWRFLTASFFSKKSERNVDLMLSKLYEPLIWRALTAASSKVRVNAATVLGNVFPLQVATLAESTTLVQKQFQALDALLSDPSPDVRVVVRTILLFP